MTAILIFMISVMMIQNEKNIFDFNSPETSGEWRIINDVVMGGVSNSKIELSEAGTMKFYGTLSPDNNGGFASIRAYLESGDISDYEGITIKAKGDGNLYNIRFRTNTNYDGPAYQAKFKSDKEEWSEFKISFTEFNPTFRGSVVTNQPELISNDIKQVGILIADKQFGEFELNIDWIKFYK